MFGFLAWLGAATAHATPATLSFTGQLSTASGPVDGPVNITLTIFDAQTGGAQVWTDTVAVTADLGRVVATLGRPTSNPIDDTVFTGAARFLEVKVQDETLSPRLTINSIPYAIHSARADSADVTTDPTVQRRRPSSNRMSCPPGSYIQAIDENGQATCKPAFSCQWVTNSAAYFEVTATCPPNYWALTGACYTNSGASPLTIFVPTNDMSGWYCRTTNNNGIGVGAYCCATAP